MNHTNTLKLWAMLAGTFLYGISITYGQKPKHSNFFYHIDKNDGLYDGSVTAFAQDKFGYIWIGTISGLYRYNSCGLKAFLPNAQDSLNAPFSSITTMVKDRNDNLWIGTTDGVYYLDDQTGEFRRLPESQKIHFNQIKNISKRYIICYTRKGVAIIDNHTYEFKFCNPDCQPEITKQGVYCGELYKNVLYIGADTGIICYDLNKKSILKIISNINEFSGITSMTMDQSGILYAIHIDCPGFLYKINPRKNTVETINILKPEPNDLIGKINQLLVDSKDRLWISTNYRGIGFVNKSTMKCTYLSYKAQPLFTGLSNNQTTQLFEDNKKNIWIGTEGFGINYFNPDAPSFDLYIPEFDDQKPQPVWCRTVALDKQGGVWMGTMSGIIVYHSRAKSVKHLHNSVQQKKIIQNNSIRSMICDAHGDIWVGTADGVNKISPDQSEIKFFTEKDSLPRTFYWSIIEDSKSRIWFGSKEGLFFKDKDQSQVYSVASIPCLKKYNKFAVRSLYEDSRKNFWIGLNGNGVLFYNADADTACHYESIPGNKNYLIGGIVTSIIEDKDGFIWFSTYNGISRYNYNTNTFNSYNHTDGLNATKTSCLQVDDGNRLWVGTTAGLYVLEPNRSNFRVYNSQNGLPNVEFNDQASFKFEDGLFVYPTLGGFLFFDPEEFSPDTAKLNFYISSFTVNNKPLGINQTTENLKKISLSHKENFFNIELVSVNYTNPDQAWYAYKLEGINKDWIYTQNRNISYTNIPGGSYTFKYKATNDVNNWNVEEKQLQITVGIVFYKHPAFILFIILSLSLLTYYFIKYRFRKQSEIYLLENRSKALEKEKATVQYEILKQQLNPHLLFNTISSINSLVKINPQLASEYLESMSKIYRYILKSNENNLVTVEAEIEFVQNYIKLQLVRYDDGMQVHINLSQEAKTRLIISVTLQNLIENAIKHNIVDQESPLIIHIYDEGNYLVVKNNLQIKRTVETSNKQGLYNLTMLYKYFTQQKIIIIETSTSYIIKIPLL